MAKIIIELKVIEIKDAVLGKEKYNRLDVVEPASTEENKIKLEVDSYEKAEAKTNAFFKMLGL